MAHLHQAFHGMRLAAPKVAKRAIPAGPARGIMIGLGLSALLWTGLVLVVRPFF